MTIAATCPDRTTFDDLLANRLGGEQADLIRTHIAACASCQTRLTDATRSGRDDGTLQVGRTSTHAALAPPRGPGELGWLGEYRVLGILGEGGMAVVYDAEEPKLGRRVALKVLRAEINDAAARERFLREARLVASLTCDRVVHVYAVGEVNGVPFLAMEKLHGETLAGRLQRDRWLPVADALAVAREAAEGLATLHTHGLIHRDIKPDNLWLESSPDGRMLRVKLIDFGIARHMEGDPALTNPGQLIGTPAYMAPEQASGDPIDARTDLYALGCVLYRMVAGHTPFDTARANTMAVLAAVIRNEMTPIRKAVPTLSQPVAELIQQLLEHEPGRRPSSAAELAARLLHLEHEERAATSKTKMIQARAAASPRRTPRRVQPWSIALGVAAIVAALGVGTVALYLKLGPAPREPAPAQADPGSTTAPDNLLPIKVGVLFSQTDAAAAHELPLLEAVQFAIEEINADGGVLGRPVEPVLADGGSNDQQFARKAAALVDDARVAVIFGCWTSGARKRVAQVCAEPQRDRLLFYPGHHEGVEEFPNVVYLGGVPNQLLVPLLKYAYADLRKRRLFLVGNDAIAARVFGEITAHEVQLLDARLVGTAYLPPGEAAMKPIVGQIQEAKADFVISALAGAENVALFRALRAARLGPPAVATGWLNLGPADLVHFPPTLAGDFTVACYVEGTDRAANAAFGERYRKRFGASKRISDTVEAAYAGVHLWKQAVEKAGSLRTWDVRVALRGLTVDAPHGPLKIDPLTLHAWHTGLVCRVIEDDGRLAFRVVHQTPGSIEPVLFPPWRTRPQWQAFRDQLYRQWGNQWHAP